MLAIYVSLPAVTFESFWFIYSMHWGYVQIIRCTSCASLECYWFLTAFLALTSSAIGFKSTFVALPSSVIGAL